MEAQKDHEENTKNCLVTAKPPACKKSKSLGQKFLRPRLIGELNDHTYNYMETKLLQKNRRSIADWITTIRTNFIQ